MAMAKKYGFEKLHVYQLAEQLSDLVWNMVQGWRPLAVSTVGVQLIRAADRVGADIAEGTGRSSPKDNRRFVDDARGSLYETRHWLRRAFRRSLLTARQIEELQMLIERMGPMLNAYRNTLKRKSNLKPQTSNL
jgi:four helix bundle protein